MRKQRPRYPVAKTATRQPQPATLTAGKPPRSTLAEIDVTVLAGRSDLRIGDRVVIGGGGLYAGESAVLTSNVSGLIPAATVRTEAGKVRRVRAVDLHKAPLSAPVDQGHEIGDIA